MTGSSAGLPAGAAVVVTGGAGFIGSHLVTTLLARGATVRVLDDLSSGRRENLAHLDEHLRSGRLTLLAGDVRNADDCARACGGADAVFHLAAMVSVERSLAAPEECFARNAQGAAQVFAAAAAAGVRRVVNISSSAVYGDAAATPSREGSEGRALSPYAASKAAAELLAHALRRSTGQEIVSLRFFNVYGSRQDPNGPYAAVIPRFLAAARAGLPCTIYGDGLQTRDFVHVDDAVEACLLAAAAPVEACGESFNVASGNALSIADVAARVRALHGGPAAVHAPARDGEIRHSVGDPARAARLLGFRARVPFADGLASL